MADDIVVTVEGEGVAPVSEQVSDVLASAVEIAETIDQARKQGESEAKWDSMITEDQFATLNGKLDGLFEALAAVTGLVNFVIDELATINAVQQAEIIETESETKVDDIVETAEEILPKIEEVSPEVPSVPEPRQSRKARFI